MDSLAKEQDSEVCKAYIGLPEGLMEGEQCWDEACLQKGAYSAEMVHAFLLGVAERNGSAFSREEGCS